MNRNTLKGGNMKTIFQALAKYNGSVNQSVLELLEPLEKEKIMMKTKAYYPSIFDTFLHIFIADLNWLKRYRGVFKESEALSNSKLVSLEEKSLRKEFESDYTKLFQYRKQADDVITQFINEIDENKLNSVIKYKNYKGEDVEKECWKTILHWLSHPTHHRGQISVLLDMVGIDNDYSSVVSRI
jgi:uncharacterized damage-inducible protein DinB